MVDIVIDTREKIKDYFLENLSTSWIVKLDKLDAGDFLIPGVGERDAILIERKDDSDFLKSLQGTKDMTTGLWVQGRLWNQLERMTKSGVGKLRLLIEGNPYRKNLTAYKKGGFFPERLWGTFEGIADWGVPVIMKKNKDETLEWLNFLIKRQNRPKKLYPLRASAKKEMSLRDKKLYLLQGLPKIGPVTSKSIYGEYGTIIDALFDCMHWDKINRIGPSTAKEAYDILVSENETI